VMLVGTAKVLLSVARLTLEPLRAGAGGARSRGPRRHPEHANAEPAAGGRIWKGA